MIIRLTDLNGNLLLVNVNLVEAIYLRVDKRGDCTVVMMKNYWVEVRETVTQISLLLQDNNLVVK